MKISTLVVGALLATVGLWFGLTPDTARAQERPRQPLMGFDGELVKLPQGTLPGGPEIRGMKVLSVSRGSPAARIGLERGDIVINIDTYSFKSRDGYMAALRQASEKPSIILLNVRNGKLTRRSCSLPHVVDEGKHPDTVRLAIDLREDMRQSP